MNITRRTMCKYLGVGFLSLTGLSLVGCQNNNQSQGNNNQANGAVSHNGNYGDDTLGNSAANINNGGLVTQQGDWIYYINPNGLFKVKTDGSERTPIYSGNTLHSINAIGDYLYFHESNKGIFKMAIAETESSESTMELVVPRANTNFLVVGDWIYYLDSHPTERSRDGLYRIKTDGTGYQRLDSRAVQSINVADDWIYFNYGSGSGTDVSDAGVYKIKTDGTELTQILAGKVNPLIVENNRLYFYNSYSKVDEGAGIYCMTTDGANRALVYADEQIRFDTLNYADGWFYYSTDDTLRKVNRETAERTDLIIERIADGRAYYAQDINIVEDHIYFRHSDKDHHEMLYRCKTDGTELKAME